jgi:plasmid maintenance system killer protein
LKVTFANRTLERCALDTKRAKREWRTAGVGQAYVDAIQVLLAFDRLEQLYQIRKLGLHALHGDMAGRYSQKLTAAWRLIFQHYPEGDEVYIVEVKDYRQ